eukprot:4146676-Amphidinium_carterae.1
MLVLPQCRSTAASWGYPTQLMVAGVLPETPSGRALDRAICDSDHVYVQYHPTVFNYRPVEMIFEVIPM